MNGIEKMAFNLYAMEMSGLLPTRTSQIEGIIQAILHEIEVTGETDLDITIEDMILSDEEMAYIEREVKRRL